MTTSNDKHVQAATSALRAVYPNKHPQYEDVRGLLTSLLVYCNNEAFDIESILFNARVDCDKVELPDHNI